MDGRGEPIRFIGGTFVGSKGWLNTQRSATKCMLPVIIDMGEGAVKYTLVSKESVALESTIKPPRCVEEAILQQHLDLEKKLNHLVKQFAQCGLQSPDQMTALFKLRLQRAIDKQRNKGSKAWFRPVVFDSDQMSSSG